MNPTDVIVNLINCLQKTFASNERYLNDLDQAIGDGDHGSNINRGIHAIQSKIITKKDWTYADAIKTSAQELMAHVGGSSGPLLAVCLLKMVTVIGADSNPPPVKWLEAMELGIKGIMDLGKSQVGQKTLLDVLDPVIKNLQRQLAVAKKIDFEQILKTAQASCLLTKDMIAKAGRASYLGERSIGTIDPGAQSVTLFFECFVQVVNHG